MGRPRKRPCPEGETTQKQPERRKSSDRPKPTLRSSILAKPKSKSPKIPISTPQALPTTETTEISTKSTVSDPTLLPDDYNIFSIPGTASLNDLSSNLDLSLLDSMASNMSFLDFMNLDPHQPFDPALVAPELMSLTYPVEAPHSKNQFQFGIGGLFDGANFENLVLDIDASSQPDVGGSSTRYNILETPSESTSPSIFSVKTPLSSISDSTSTEPQQTYCTPGLSSPCVCLANLFLALEGLQQLPSGVREAMCAARYANRVAHDCIECPSCSAPLTQDAHPPIQSAQNMMIMGALFPVLADAYMKIVQMIDLEFQQAHSERRKLYFNIYDFGGVWGPLARVKECSQSEALQGDMDPTLWRQIVRAMLKLDVYGMDECPNGSEKISLLGLSGIINKLEERSLKRHEMLDDSPELQDAIKSLNYPSLAPGEKPTCLRIVDMAKMAVKRIVIA